MRVVVTGAGGRLGNALLEALSNAPFSGLGGPIGWDRRSFDLDAPDAVVGRLDEDRPDVVVHAAAWTDVDGCASDPELALRRNGAATGVLAEACAARGIDLIVISTNEVFDGRRTDGRGYRPDDPVAPINAYGASKLEAERRARAAFGAGRAHEGTGRSPSYGRSGRLAIVRTAWLFGPPGNDFPSKILVAALHAEASGTPLRVVGDEMGSPTYTHDLAEAIVRMIEADRIEGTHHGVNTGQASRADWARALLRGAGLQPVVEDVPAATWVRVSTPPLWGVLESTLGATEDEPMRPWTEALAADLPRLLRHRATAR